MTPHFEVLVELRDELVADGEGFNVPEANTKHPFMVRMWRSARVLSPWHAGRDTSGGAERLIEDWSRIEWEGLDSTNLSALRDRVIEVVGQLRGDSRALHDRLCEILVAQDYQDVIGQVIQRVVQLLQEVEAKLATMASLSGGIAKQAYGRGRAGTVGQEAQARPRVFTSQGEVDELLAALGR